VLERCGSGVPHEWHVEEVEPECRLIAFVGMTMPSPGWGQDNITGRHIDPPSVYPV